MANKTNVFDHAIFQATFDPDGSLRPESSQPLPAKVRPHDPDAAIKFRFFRSKNEIVSVVTKTTETIRLISLSTL
jgi:hypothetical protein